MTDIENLASVRTLRRTDGQGWATALEPVFRDTVQFETSELTGLTEFGQLVSLLLSELARYPLPEYVIYAHPNDGPAKNSPLAFASALVAHRAERLVQAAELTAGALDALENGVLLVSSVTARSLLEMTALSVDIHQPLLEPWRAVHGNLSQVRAATKADDFATFRLLWETRMATRFYGEKEGLPVAKGILNKIDRLDKKISGTRNTYDMLCDATHPNIEANASLWRTDYFKLGAHKGIRFAPGSSNSIIKRYIVNTIHLSLWLIIPFSRDLWWIAADITNTCGMTPNDRTLRLGLPARTGRADACSCGSGSVTRLCTHPEPKDLTQDEVAGA